MNEDDQAELEWLRAQNARRERGCVAMLLAMAEPLLTREELLARAPGCDPDALCRVPHEGAWGYPAFQLTEGDEVLPGLVRVLAALPTKEGLSQLDFLFGGHPALRRRSPLDALWALSRGKPFVDLEKLEIIARTEYDHGGY